MLSETGLLTLRVLCDQCRGGVHNHDWVVLTGGFQDGACHYVTIAETSAGDEMVSCGCEVR